MNSESESMGSAIDDLLSRSGTVSPASHSDAAHAEAIAQLTKKILAQDRTIKVNSGQLPLDSEMSANPAHTTGNASRTPRGYCTHHFEPRTDDSREFPLFSFRYHFGFPTAN